MKNLFKISFLASIVSLYLNNSASAQLIPDQSLGNESSIVNSTNNLLQIEGGATRGNNLFHSFREFNVNTNQEVFFNNSINIESIFTRVTGGNISNIDGLVSNVGQADLFILNPAGIVFGENAQINIGGSLFVTTAESILFGNNFEFSAINPNTPPLLTVNMPIGLQLGENAGDIINKANFVKEERFGEEQLPLIFPIANRNIPREQKIVNTLVGLEVNRGDNITFVGGNIILDGGGLSALGGKIELGGLATKGIIRIDSNGNLVFPENLALSDIKLINDSSIDVQGSGNGDIIITGQNIEVRDGSTLLAGIRAFEGSAAAKAGDIIINGIDRVAFDGVRGANSKRDGENFHSSASNTVGLTLEKQFGIENNSQFELVINGRGQGGNIEINTKQLDITNGARIISLTFGEGNSGDILINATEEINLKTDEDFFKQNNRTQVRTVINNTIFATKDVNSGKIKINTPSLNLLNRSNITSRIFRGEGGGNAGNIEINTQYLNLVDDARIIQLINNRNLKEGDTANLGDIIINAEEQVSVTGINNRNRDSRIVNVFNKGQANVFKGTGNTGDIIFNTQNFRLANGSKVSNRITGRGSTGNIIINAGKKVILDSKKASQSAIFNTINAGGNGQAGNIVINTEELLLTNGSLISQNLAPQGKGSLGKIEINANNILIDGKISVSELGFFSESSIYNTVNTNATGNGNIIKIDTENLSLTNEGQLFTSTLGNGNAGNVKIQAQKINIIGGNIESNATIFKDSNGNIFKANGNGGTIDIETNNLNLSNKGTISVSSDANGDIGQISIKTNSLELSNESEILAETDFNNSQSEVSGDNFDIDIDVKNNLILKDNSLISAKATQQADGGNAQINADFIVAFPQNNDIIATAEQGDGGKLNITTNTIFGLESRNKETPLNDITASSEFGLDGDVEIRVLDTDPAQSLTELPENIVDASRLITKSCLAGDEENKFVATGRGGLPANPNESLRDSTVLSAEWVSLEPNQNNPLNVETSSERKARNYHFVNRIEANDTKPLETSTDKIVEAQGWIIGDNGNVILTAASNPKATIKQPWFLPHDCSQ
ncbi:MAG: filamentous hemagglutinin N-terminal domain-containing protein [Xenococcaceae cyanobacterium MO_167.B52]|nr:filamentous hemagglutinin N-terminal domain-containing protein [Xenococcaceae cyanobacterium MO_167.B52]